jgi:phosphocarrier protein
MVEGQEKSIIKHSKTKTFVITNELGLHLRPAGLLVKAANKYDCAIMIEKDGMKADGKSIIEITALHVTKNTAITIKACGHDADQAIEDLERLITSNFSVPK